MSSPVQPVQFFASMADQRKLTQVNKNGSNVIGVQ
jgi:hypothetical protein